MNLRDPFASLNHLLQISLDLAEEFLFLFVFLNCEGLVINMSARFCNSLDEITFFKATKVIVNFYLIHRKVTSIMFN